MTQEDPDARRLAELEEQLRKARRHGGKPSQADQSSSSIGIAFRLSFDIVAAVVVGAGAGWLLDRMFGTSPLLFIVFFFLGAGAGFFNVIRSANRMNRDELKRSGQDGPDRK